MVDASKKECILGSVAIGFCVYLLLFVIRKNTENEKLKDFLKFSPVIASITSGVLFYLSCKGMK